jgi:hypothetical protein
MSTEGEFVEDVMEDDQSLSNKLNFEMILMKQLERTTFFLSRLNDTPSYVFHAMVNPQNNLNPDEIKPNKDNFIYSVIAMKSLLKPYHDKLFIEQEQKLLERFKERKSQKDSVELAKVRFNHIMELMSRKSLLPIQMMV